ncbi:MAG: hypothetical protein HW406_97 [Candidatus Brocadiaceae bacterium]|nr:hypothetical protein [Candidatus Brocadiaceae bacterium]
MTIDQWWQAICLVYNVAFRRVFVYRFIGFFDSLSISRGGELPLHFIIIFAINVHCTIYLSQIACVSEH